MLGRAGESTLSRVQQVGPYEVTGELGRGGMGVVLRGRGPDGRAVAVKLLLRRKPEAVERFAREVRLLRELGAEQGFVPILDAGQGPQGPWLAMPLLEGGTLRDRLRGGPLGVEQAVALGQAIARAVGLAHARGIVHRDLKPENVLFTGPGQPLVADLGLAKHFSDAHPGASQSVDLTRTGELKGTLGYMAPEQVNDSKSVGPATDVFALGAILYELLAGEAPFAGDSAHETLARIVTGDRAPLRSKRRDVPAWLAAVVERALRPRAAERWPDGAALAAALAAGPGPRGHGGRLAAAGVALGVVALAVAGLARSGAPPGAQEAREATGAAPVESRAPASEPERPRPAPRPPAAASGPAARVRTSGALRVLGAWGGRAGALRDHGRGVRFGPDGLLLAADTAGRLVAFAPEDGAFVRLVGALPAPIVAFDVSSDGRLAAACDAGGVLAAWEVASGREVWRVEQPPGDVAALAFSPDGGLLTWTAPGRGVKAAEVSTGVTKVVDPAQGGVALAYAAKGFEALVVGEDVRLVDTWNDVARVRRPTGATGAAFPRGGSCALLLEADGRVTRWDPALRRAQGSFGDDPTAGAPPAEVLAASDDGLVVATGGPDGRVAVWDARTGERRAELLATGSVRGLALSGDGRALAVIGGDCRVRLYDLEDRALRPRWDVPGLLWLTTIVPRPDGGLVVAGLEGVERWDLATGVRAPLFVGHRGAVNGVALSPSGLLALSVAHDRTARVWSTSTGRELAELPLSRNNALSCAVSPDGRLGLVGADDPAVFLVDLTALRVVRRLEGESLHWVRRVAFDSTGRTALAADHGGRIHLWEVATGRPIAWFSPGPQRPDREGAPAWLDLRDGLERILCTSGPEVGLWDLTEGSPRRLADFEQRGFSASRALLLPDRRRALVLGSEELRLLDVVERAERGRLDVGPLGDLLWTMTLADDGRSVWVGTHAGLVLRLAF